MITKEIYILFCSIHHLFFHNRCKYTTLIIYLARYLYNVDNTYIAIICGFLNKTKHLQSISHINYLFLSFFFWFKLTILYVYTYSDDRIQYVIYFYIIIRIIYFNYIHLVVLFYCCWLLYGQRKLLTVWLLINTNFMICEHTLVHYLFSCSKTSNISLLVVVFVVIIVKVAIVEVAIVHII